MQQLHGPSQTPPLVVGTWRLVSFEARYENGEVWYPLGRKAVGQLSYGTEGYVSAIVVLPDRLPFTSGDSRRGADAGVRAAFEGSIGYFGTYSIDAEKGTATHHVLGASFPNWMGGDQVRFYKLEGTELILSTPATFYGGERGDGVLVWERIE